MADLQDGALGRLEALMARLRAECPWKAEQTHASLRRYLLEESHELLEAIDIGDDEHLREELGDVLLQVLFHAAIAAERGAFDLEDVATTLEAKMVRRNPHVFGDDDPTALPLSAIEVDARWQQIKAEEKQHRTSAMEGVPASLPALLWADKAVGRAPERFADLVESSAHVDASSVVGERLLALVAQARAAGVDPEHALRDAVRARLTSLSEDPPASEG